ncbi:MAG: ATP-grasp domain-containing protein [Oscillospiraceae bacterium]|nr:ATP-grasp domain-containing protein [Oscillospiraceae bacterium]
MKTVILTDAKYRSAISAARVFGRAGYRVVAAQPAADTRAVPPVFSSRYAAEGRMLDGGAADAAYPARLLALIREYERPVLFPVGAATLGVLSRERERFAPHCDFLVSAPEVLDAVNDKQLVHRRALELGLSVPKEYDGEPETYPVIVKPRCGEKFGLKAAERYAVARDPGEFAAALERMRRFDPAPVVQELVSGTGGGACVLLDRDSRLVAGFCHRRVREYPIYGGPSACCESVFEPEKLDAAYRLLRSFGFTGLAMVEFKGERILEVNPRVWGSFPLTALAHSPIALRYAQAAAGERVDYVPCDYDVGVRMRFALNDTLAAFSLFAHGRLREAAAGVADLFRAREALSDRDDPAPMRAYLKAAIMKR